MANNDFKHAISPLVSVPKPSQDIATISPMSLHIAVAVMDSAMSSMVASPEYEEGYLDMASAASFDVPGMCSVQTYHLCFNRYSLIIEISSKVLSSNIVICYHK